LSKYAGFNKKQITITLNPSKMAEAIIHYFTESEREQIIKLLKSEKEGRFAVSKYLHGKDDLVNTAFIFLNEYSANRLIDYLKKKGALPYRDIYRGLNISSKELMDIAKPLAQAGIINFRKIGTKEGIAIV
jgi:hypothetical protein